MSVARPIPLLPNRRTETDRSSMGDSGCYSLLRFSSNTHQQQTMSTQSDTSPGRREVWLSHYFEPKHHLAFSADEEGDHFAPCSFWHVDMTRPLGQRRIGKVDPRFTAPQLVEWAIRILASCDLPPELSDLALKMFDPLPRTPKNQMTDSVRLLHERADKQRRDLKLPLPPLTQDILAENGAVEVGGITLGWDGAAFSFSPSEKLDWPKAVQFAAAIIRDRLTQKVDCRFFVPWLAYPGEECYMKLIPASERTRKSGGAPAAALSVSIASPPTSVAVAAHTAAAAKPSDAGRCLLLLEQLEQLVPKSGSTLGSALAPILRLALEDLRKLGAQAPNLPTLAELERRQAEVQQREGALAEREQALQEAQQRHQASLADIDQKRQAAAQEVREQFTELAADLQKREAALQEAQAQLQKDRAQLTADQQQVYRDLEAAEQLKQEAEVLMTQAGEREAAANKVLADHLLAQNTPSASSGANGKPAPVRTWGAATRR